jgi:molybdate transport system substrate-binding protein
VIRTHTPVTEDHQAVRASLKIFSTLAVQGALPALTERYGRATGTRVDVHFEPTNGLLARIAAGEGADIAILTRAAIDDLAAKGVLIPDSVTDVAVSLVGIAVKAGAPKPDIGSVETLKATLLGAKSIAYSRIGASGVFFAELIQRLGIDDAVNVKATVIASGLTAELAARGTVELAVQQVSELLLVPGIDVVGPLPSGADSVTMFSAGVLAMSVQAEAALELIGYLRSSSAAQALCAAGLQPAA